MAARTLSLLLALASAGAASAQSVSNISENATVALLVSNRAAVDVVLANCDGNHSVPAGSNVTLHVTWPEDLSWQFWVVPNDTVFAWKCDGAEDESPFIVFGTGYFGLSPIIVFVRNGLPTLEGGNVTLDPTLGNRSKEVAGVAFDAGPAFDGAVLRCRQDESCFESHFINGKTLPDSLALNIMGPQASLLSFWRVGGQPVNLAARGGGGGRGSGGGHAGMPRGASGAGSSTPAPVAGGR